MKKWVLAFSILSLGLVSAIAEERSISVTKPVDQYELKVVQESSGDDPLLSYQLCKGSRCTQLGWRSYTLSEVKKLGDKEQWEHTGSFALAVGSAGVAAYLIYLGQAIFTWANSESQMLIRGIQLVSLGAVGVATWWSVKQSKQHEAIAIVVGEKDGSQKDVLKLARLVDISLKRLP